MIFSHEDFTTGNKWANNTATYNSTDTSRVIAKLQEKGYTYDTNFGVKPIDTAIVQQAFTDLLKHVNFTASNVAYTAQTSISLSMVKGLTSPNATSPDTIAGGVTFGIPNQSVSIAINLTSGNSITVGSREYKTLLHEIAHALGLYTDAPNDHPHLKDDDANYIIDNTIMSYLPGKYLGSNFGEAVNPITPMMYDIAALQHLYGAKTSTTSGNNTYSITGVKQGWTIWDAGGYDVLDASGITGKSVTLDLRGGADDDNNVFFSLVGDRLGRTASDKYYGKLYNTTEAIAIGYQNLQVNDKPVVIEEARGGAGNDALMAGEGSKLYGNAGNDTLVGGAGVNSLYGGDGTDFSYSDHDDVVRTEAGQDVLAVFQDFKQMESTIIAGSSSYAQLYGGEGSDHFGIFGKATIKDIEVIDRVYLNNLEVSGGIKPKEFDTPIAINGFKGHLFAVLGGDINNENGATLAVKHLWDNDAVANDNNISFQILRKAD